MKMQFQQLTQCWMNKDDSYFDYKEQNSYSLCGSQKIGDKYL